MAPPDPPANPAQTTADGGNGLAQTGAINYDPTAKPTHGYDKAFESTLQTNHDSNESKPRKLVFLADGTCADASREYSADEPDTCKDGTRNLYPSMWVGTFPTQMSNVYHFGQALPEEWTDAKGKAWYQEIHYQNGIGTDKESYTITNTLNMMTGQGIAARVRDGFTWLSNRWRPGDEVYIVGFSRGAYIARSVGGMVSRYGLYKPTEKKVFKPEDPEMEKMYEYYKQRMTPEHEPEPKILTNCTGPSSVSIEAICCWETVGKSPGFSSRAQTDKLQGALGIPYTLPLMPLKAVENYWNWDYDHFHDTTLNDAYKNAFHALALNDHMSPFQACLWEKPPGCHTKLEQCWFPGSHMDCGGGFWKDNGMPLVTLAWFFDKLEGMLGFDEKLFASKVKRLLEYYKDHGITRRWGKAKTHDLRANIVAMIAMSASDRTPGWYYRIDPKNGKETSEPLTNTCETIHRTVRDRYGLSNMGADDSGTYNPGAANGSGAAGGGSATGSSSTAGGSGAAGGSSAAASSTAAARNDGKPPVGRFTWKWNGWTGYRDEIPEAMPSGKWEKQLIELLNNGEALLDAMKTDQSGNLMDLIKLARFRS